jgi:choline dehydrogenase-like flavoprotein
MVLCPTGARYTAARHVDAAIATGHVEVITGAHVTQLRLRGRREAGSVLFYDREGRRREMEARHFVLAAGGIENPRLLLNSAADGPHSRGLANSSGMVGRNLMMGTVSHIWGKVDGPTDPLRIGFNNAESWDFYRHERPGEQGNWIMRFGPWRESPDQVALATHRWGDQVKKHVRESRPHGVGVWAFHESPPSPENRVETASRVKDKFGMPAPVVTYGFSAYAQRTSRQAQGVGRRVLDLMGARDAQASAGPMTVSVHHMGTTRMGPDPAMSVCDSYGRCHDVDNLHMAGSSLFPTAGCSTPTLTIAALALRTAESLGGLL